MSCWWQTAVLLHEEQRQQANEQIRQLVTLLELEHDPLTTATFLASLGSWYRLLGLLAEALRALDSAAETCPTLAEAYWQRHLLFLVYGLDELALSELGTMKGYMTTVPYKLWRSSADLRYRLGKFSEAAADYQASYLLCRKARLVVVGGRLYSTEELIMYLRCKTTNLIAAGVGSDKFS